MSDTPKNPDAGGQEVDAIAAAAKGEINALVESVRSQKAAFDTTADTSTKAISAELDKAKATTQEISSLRNDVTSAKGAIETERDDLVSKSKATQTEIEGTRNNIASIKGAIESVQKAATADAAAVAQSKLEAEKLKAAATELSGKLAADHATLTQQVSELQKTKDALDGVLKQVSGLKAAAEKDSATAKGYLDEINKAKERFSGLNSETGVQYDALVKRQSELGGKITEIETAHNKINDLRRSLLESSDDAVSVQDQIGQLKASITTILADVTQHRDKAAADLDVLIQKASNDREEFFVLQDKKFADLFASLEKRILGLLPSAGAAGLASTYYDAKSRYAPTSFAGRHGDTGAKNFQERARRWMGYNPASVVATVFFYALFLLPLAFIIFESIRLLYRIENDPHFVLHYDMFVVRLLIVVPLVTLSGFGFASLQLYRRLYEEYNHKQRVMELYKSFSEEISTSGSDAQKKELLDIMLRSVSQKAWDVSATKPDNRKDDFDLLSRFERLTTDLAKLKEIVGH